MTSYRLINFASGGVFAADNCSCNNPIQYSDFGRFINLEFP